MKSICVYKDSSEIQTYFTHTSLQNIIHIRTIHTIPKNNHFRSFEQTKFYRSTKTEITPIQQELSILHKNYINNIVRTNPLLSNISDENSLTTPISKKTTAQF